MTTLPVPAEKFEELLTRLLLISLVGKATVSKFISFNYCKPHWGGGGGGGVVFN